MKAMLERRELLGAGIFGAAMVGVSGLPRNGVETPAPLLIVTQPSVPESGRFAAALAAASNSPLALAVGTGLDELLGDWTERRGIIAGLTSDPAAMIADQLLLEAGAEPLLRWEHSYEMGRWSHRVDGDPGLLTASHHAWPAIVAQHVHELLDQKPARRDRSACFSGYCPLDSGSPGLLITWTYRLAGGDR